MTISSFNDISLNDIYLVSIKKYLLVGEIILFPVLLTSQQRNNLGVLLCDGDEYNPFTYPDLSNIISNDYGESASGNFLLPNLISPSVSTNTGNHYYLRGRANMNQISTNIISNNKILENMLPSHNHNLSFNTGSNVNSCYNSSDSNVKFNTGSLNQYIIPNTNSINSSIDYQKQSSFNFISTSVETQQDSDQNPLFTNEGGNGSNTGHNNSNRRSLHHQGDLNHQIGIDTVNTPFNTTNAINFNLVQNDTKQIASVSGQSVTLTDSLTSNTTKNVPNTTNHDNFFLKTNYGYYYICVE